MRGELALEDGSELRGQLFGRAAPAAGEVVFTTGMVGYPECLTDPSYRGQILVFTYPLIGNYGVPSRSLERLESDRIQVAGVVVARSSPFFSHAGADASLDEWLMDAGVPGLSGVDTRALTRHLRERGTMLGRIVAGGEAIDWDDPNARNLVCEVSVEKAAVSGTGARRVLLADFGCKRSIETALVERGLTVERVPWDHPFDESAADGVLLSNGPGDPRSLPEVVARVRRLLEQERPVLGICLGHQLMSLAAGAEVYKLPYGHRGQNQPCLDLDSGRCLVTSQNHGFAVRPDSMADGWRPWFVNKNDGSCEGILRDGRPHLAVQFHPEARPGPVDASFVFDRFAELVHGT